MPSISETRRLYNALVGSDNIVYGVFPNGAASVTLTAAAGVWTFGVWAQIVASVGAADVWVCGVAVENPSAPAAGYDVGIGRGPGASEVNIATVPIFQAVVFLPFPIRVPAVTRLAGRVRSSTGAADTIAVKALIITGA